MASAATAEVLRSRLADLGGGAGIERQKESGGERVMERRNARTRAVGFGPELRDG